MPEPRDLSAFIEALRLPPGSGLTAKQLADRFKISVPTVVQWIAHATVRGHRFERIEILTTGRGRPPLAFRLIV